ncbi:hypothetical protein KEM55_005472 [Ascosphaera atra]|nr:hypothetical protein KEM55_005472 [Ascosphaera atra]
MSTQSDKGSMKPVEAPVLTMAGWRLYILQFWYALVIITAGSIGCGCSQTLNQLIAFRTLQGLGGAGLYSVPLIVLPEITPVKQFRILGALIGIAITVSAVV